MYFNTQMGEMREGLKETDTSVYPKETDIAELDRTIQVISYPIRNQKRYELLGNIFIDFNNKNFPVHVNG